MVSAADGEAGHRVGRVHLVAYAVLLPTLVLVLGQLFTLGEDTIPFADWAVEELTTASAADFSQYIGMYSRDYIWHHPGPLIFYWFAPFYALSGGTFAGMTLAAAVLSLLLLGLIIWSAGQVWGRRGVWPAAVVVLVFQFQFGVERLRDPWTPYMIILPAAAALVMVPAIARRPSVGKVIVQAGVISLAVQTHIGAAPIALVATIGTIAAIWWGAAPDGSRWPGAADRDESRARRSRGQLFAAWLVTAAVMWSLPLFDQLRTRPGNMMSIVRFFLGDEGDNAAGQSLYPVFRRAVRNLSLAPPRLGVEIVNGPSIGDRPFTAVMVVAWVVAVGAIVGLVVMTVRRRRSIELDLLGYPLVAAIALLFASLRIVGPLEPYLFTGFVGIGLALWWALLGAGTAELAEALGPRLRNLAPQTRRGLAGGALAALVAASVWQAVEVADDDRSFFTAPELVQLEPALDLVCDRQEDRFQVSGEAAPWFFALGVGVGLQRCGKSVSFSPELAAKVGTNYSARPTEVYVVLSTPERTPPGNVVIGRSTTYELSVSPGDLIRSSGGDGSGPEGLRLGW